MVLPLLLLAAVASLTAQSPALISRDSAQHLVSQRVADHRSTGLIVGVLTPQGEAYVVSAGNERAGKPIDRATLVEIGSITKVFTGILLADMARRGEVRFDEPVTEILPQGTQLPTRNGKQITLADLSTQSSGLPRMPDNMRPADPANPYADYTPAQMFEFLGRYQLPRDVGAQYEYSNLGVGLLGYALAQRYRKPYEQLVKDRVLQPLGMTHSGITLTPEMRAHMAEGHDPAGTVVPLWDLPTLAGAGALRSSMDDMLKFLAANMTPPNNGIGAAIATSHVPRYKANQALQLGLNWHITNFQGDTMIWHNGGTAGFRTMIAMNPKTKTGAVLLGTSSQDNEDIVRHILVNAPLIMPVVHKEITLPAETLQQYVGTYQFAPQFSIQITVENGALFAQATDQPKFAVFAEAPDKFFLKVVDAQLEFTRDATGAVTAMTLVQGGGRQPGRKVK